VSRERAHECPLREGRSGGVGRVQIGRCTEQRDRTLRLTGEHHTQPLLLALVEGFRGGRRSTRREEAEVLEASRHGRALLLLLLL
jgi:hypothetical protein